LSINNIYQYFIIFAEIIHLCD